MRLSRSARNRAAARAVSNQTVPRGVIPARRVHNSPHDLAHNSQSSIRIPGYLGRNPTKTHYAGSGAAGYTSEWAMQGHDFFTDSRWDK